MKRPENWEPLGYFHLLLRQAGAKQYAEGYRMNGHTIRVVNGASAVLSKLRSRFTEAPATVTAEIVVAVGATDLGLPGNVIRPGRAGDSNSKASCMSFKLTSMAVLADEG
jgi:hypothetical protein